MIILFLQAYIDWQCHDPPKVHIKLYIGYKQYYNVIQRMIMSKNVFSQLGLPHEALRVSHEKYGLNTLTNIPNFIHLLYKHYEWYWKLDNLSKFMVHSLTFYIHSQILKFVLTSWLWNNQVPYKINIFVLIAILNILAIIYNLSIGGLVSQFAYVSFSTNV